MIRYVKNHQDTTQMYLDTHCPWDVRKDSENRTGSTASINPRPSQHLVGLHVQGLLPLCPASSLAFYYSTSSPLLSTTNKCFPLTHTEKLCQGPGLWGFIIFPHQDVFPKITSFKSDARCSSSSVLGAPRLLTLMCKWRGSPQGKQKLQQPGRVTHGGSRWPQARVWAPGNTANRRKEICQGPYSYQSTGRRDHKMKTLIKKQTLLPWALGNRDFQ